MTATKTAEAAGQFIHVALGDLKASKTNPRKHFDEHALNELAESIKRQGIVQPILVREQGSGWEIVAGERRFRAAKIAGLELVPVIVRELTDQDVLEIQVVENLQRMDLHALEEADGYRQLMGIRGYDAARIAERVGRSVKYVYDRIKLLQLIDPLKKAFSAGLVTAGHAILLARLSKEDQLLAADKDRGGLWTEEDAHFEEIVGKSDGYKLRSVRELQQWIDEHCRFVPERDADPMLFPETAAILKTMDPKKKSDKIVAISHGYVQDSARHGEKHIAPTSWKRADGLKGSKPCDFSVIGVVVAGKERAKAFRVCLAKEKCKTHWGEWQRTRDANRKTSGKAPSGSSAEDIAKARQKEEAEREAQRFAQERWNKALPAILKELAISMKKASVPQMVKVITQHFTDQWMSGPYDMAKKNIEVGKTAEQALQYSAYNALLQSFENDMDDDVIVKTCASFGVDTKRIMDLVAPLEKSTEKKPAAKPKK